MIVGVYIMEGNIVIRNISKLLNCNLIVSYNEILNSQSPK